MKRLTTYIFCLLIFILPTQAFAVQKVPILIYHSIDEFTGHGMKELYATPKNFEKQMLYLRNHGYTLLTFDRWNDIGNVENPIFITFDDGYKNNLHAITIFKKLQNNHFKPTGTFFVISDFIGRPNRLSKSDLKMMADSGLASIQSHTATHPDLTKIDDLQYELKESKEKIQQITGKPVIALAYPYGSFNQKVIDETKKYYMYGITTISELYSKTGKKDELYLLPRIYIKYTTSMNDFAKIVNGE
ncbi:polysaccharide deacetylase family protein [Bacillus massiliigorillae]|uniref:polysaccharide deacetylase family protein n=1 Tax=Bacillus massiliigorillae TaxID=1243664 RepID=UPI0003A90A0E|nr:polysaccharide deacetylase family protein [Bacillus massiliigorillae]